MTRVKSSELGRDWLLILPVDLAAAAAAAEHLGIHVDSSALCCNESVAVGNCNDASGTWRRALLGWPHRVGVILWGLAFTSAL